jgi:hypothetical protein
MLSPCPVCATNDLVACPALFVCAVPGCGHGAAGSYRKPVIVTLTPCPCPGCSANWTAQRGSRRRCYQHPDFGSYFRHGPLGDFFAACYVSGELNLLKPHPEIYQHVLDDLGISTAGAVFIDNREANVRGAEALGITGHLFTDAAALRAFLAPVSTGEGAAGCSRGRLRTARNFSDPSAGDAQIRCSAYRTGISSFRRRRAAVFRADGTVPGVFRWSRSYPGSKEKISQGLVVGPECGDVSVFAGAVLAVAADAEGDGRDAVQVVEA